MKTLEGRCNQLEGKFIAEDQIIKIENIDLINKEKCQFSDYENNFLNILRNKTFQYSIENGVLILNDSQNKLVFKSSN